MIDKDFFLQWFRLNGRDFPWRKDNVTPFALMITEMLLRQTRAELVVKIWSSFISEYPDAVTLANAQHDLLFEQLKVLGFGNQRAIALKAASEWLVRYHGGTVPQQLERLLQIPHVGMYISRAVLCFAYGERIEIVDTNVLRLFSRYYGIPVKPDIRRNLLFWEIANKLLPDNRDKVKDHNYGILDFTALVCSSKTPKCAMCQVSNTCRYTKSKLEEDVLQAKKNACEFD